MPHIGKIEQFDDSVESWESYEERLQAFFLANDIDNNHKVPALISLIGPKTCTLLKNLIAPAKATEKSIKDLLKALREHLSPKPSVIAERFRFHKRNQRPDESVLSYMAELRNLATHCQFEAALSDTLRDRLVVGLRQETIQKRLLSEKDLDLEKAINLAVAMETAARDAAEVQGGKSETVNKISTLRNANPQPHARSTTQKHSCYRCDGDHPASQCRHTNTVCSFCRKVGHIERACMKKKRDRNKGRNTSLFYNEEESHSEERYTEVNGEPLLHITSTFHMKSHHEPPITVQPIIEGKVIKMEVDTGTAVSVISKSDYSANFGNVNLEPSSELLRAYSGDTIQPLGKMKVNVQLNSQSANLELLVVPHDGPALLGRDWLGKLKLNWQEIKTLRSSVATHPPTLKDLLDSHNELFSPGVGTLKHIKGTVTVDPGAKPVFLKARTVPYSLRTKVEQELDQLQADGIIEPVAHSKWATPIVPAIKKNGNVRLCGDYKVTVNPVMCVEKYPLPKIEDIFATLAGGKNFSKLDLTQAYHHMELDEDSQDLLVINTHKGLFKYKRLPYGIASAPALWQRAIEQVLQNIPSTQVIIDDIIVTGRTDEEHLHNLKLVLDRLQSYGLHVNLQKCEFFQAKVSYVGHEIDASGLHKSPDKIEAVKDAQRPENVSQLRSFLGLVNYYHRFLDNLSSKAGPLHELLNKGTRWEWNAKRDKAFNEIKDAICSDKVLCHYDAKLPLKLAADASPYGIGSVLSHVFPDGSERPIAFASRTLNQAEKAYSQIDKEALALYWGVRKFNSYLYGHKFTLVTDHKPLLSIFNPKKSLPVMTAARLQRYAVFLSGYQYDIEFRGTKSHGNADALSRVPLPAVNQPQDEKDPIDLFYNRHFDDLPVTCVQIRRETQRDPVLSQILDYVIRGHFPHDCDEQLKPYYNRREELNVYQGCVTWGNRVIIPDILREKVMTELHSGHIGIVKMKAVARSYVWWPKVDEAIEEVCKACSGCKRVQNTPSAAPVHPWNLPPKAWHRLHIDFAGPFHNAMFLIVVDAYSKWPEVFEMRSTTSNATINTLRTLFARQGIPAEIVSDNGPQFRSEEFRQFMESNAIRHITSSPFHPRTNGQAERFVQSFKKAIKSASGDSACINKKLNAFLCKYRITPQGTTNESPSILLYGRNIRTRLDILKPDLATTVMHKQYGSTAKHCGNVIREFSDGDAVNTRDYRSNSEKWANGRIHSRTGPLSYKVDVNGTLWRRHVDQIVRTSKDQPAYPTPVNIPFVPSVNAPCTTDKTQEIVKDAEPSTPIPEPRRNPPRTRNKPDKLNL
ncbi:uncharacterized protein K02A2.6-like [Saccostrea cucullata]|uniref:uncharacterized protein K02A2.6-like n=1 Tax=Saccostrea cuccullata TaxID=36930 RepID=UPI002ED471B1